MAKEIRYTIDGSEPNAFSPLYILPLALTQNTVVKAKVFETGRNPSETVTGLYNVHSPVGGLASLSQLTARIVKCTNATISKNIVSVEVSTDVHE